MRNVGRGKGLPIPIRRRLGNPKPPTPTVLIDYSTFFSAGTLTFTRASEAANVEPRSGWTFDTTNPWCPVNQIRILSGNAIFVEGAAINPLSSSRDVSGSAWSLTGSGVYSVTGSAIAGPDGLVSGSKVELSQSAFTRGQLYPASFPRIISVYAKLVDTPSSMSVNAKFSPPTLTASLTADYVRYFSNRVTASVGNALYPDDANLGAALPHRFYGDLYQIESGSFPTSPIRTSLSGVTRTIDRCIITSTAVPDLLRTGHWEFDAWPLMASNEIELDQLHCLVGWGTSTQAGGVYLYNNGGSIQVAVIRDNGGVAGAVGNVVWSRNQKLTITINVAALTLTLVGATSGNTTVALTTPGPICDGNITIGSPKDLGLPASFKAGFAVISPIRRVVR